MAKTQALIAVYEDTGKLPASSSSLIRGTKDVNRCDPITGRIRKIQALNTMLNYNHDDL
jgi:hypothetical protein